MRGHATESYVSLASPSTACSSCRTGHTKSSYHTLPTGSKSNHQKIHPGATNSTSRPTWEGFAATQSLGRVWLHHNMYRTLGEQLITAAQRPPIQADQQRHNTQEHSLLNAYHTARMVCMPPRPDIMHVARKQAVGEGPPPRECPQSSTSQSTLH